ncbi:hypothetical protein GCM10023100_20850 [Actinocorallia cavernae]|uniref:Uncharacterized protein n=2 Tax=Actinomycetes TaxID=1760 RepID=A0ABP8SIB8_9ACTN
MPIKAEPNRIKVIRVIKVDSNRIKAESDQGRIEPGRGESNRVGPDRLESPQITSGHR